MKMLIDIQMFRTVRINKGYSQAALAQKAGVTLLTINRLESQKTKAPHPSTMKKICDVLEIPVSAVCIQLL